MRKDGKSQYTIKKEKLLEIKKTIREYLDYLHFLSIEENQTYQEEIYTQAREMLMIIWEIVKDEK